MFFSCPYSLHLAIMHHDKAEAHRAWRSYEYQENLRQTNLDKASCGVLLNCFFCFLFFFFILLASSIEH